MDIRNKTVCVIGCARSGQAAARLACEKGARVRMSDCGIDDRVPDDFRRWMNDNAIDAEWNGHTQAFIQESDCVVLSPGVPANASPVIWAQQAGIEVVSELEFAFSYCPAPVIAVTGSNGKTTVSTLIAEVLKAGGHNVCLCGNIGSPLSSFIGQIDAMDYVVLEVSSFQLEKIQTFKPFIAVCLNMSQNHLDRHADMQEYIEAKMRIFENQSSEEFAVLNVHDETLMELKKNLSAHVIEFGSDAMKAECGFDNPNYLAVIAVAGICGMSLEICRKVFKMFKGLEHRLEYVRSIDGIDFINDSKSTTVEAARWALQRQHKPVIWICGGRDKGSDFSVLREMVKETVRHIIAIGEAAEKIQKSFQGCSEIDVVKGNLNDAVVLSKDKARPGDVVVLSPMCASFDMFQDYEHRGREFKQSVNSLL